MLWPLLMRVIALALLLLPSLGCGGSSSETPPPLEPDPTSFRYVGPRLPAAQEVEAPSSAAPQDEDDVPLQPHQPAAATWGSGKATPRPAAASPAALPAPPPATSPAAPSKPSAP